MLNGSDHRIRPSALESRIGRERGVERGSPVHPKRGAGWGAFGRSVDVAIGDQRMAIAESRGAWRWRV